MSVKFGFIDCIMVVTSSMDERIMYRAIKWQKVKVKIFLFSCVRHMHICARSMGHIITCSLSIFVHFGQCFIVCVALALAGWSIEHSFVENLTLMKAGIISDISDSSFLALLLQIGCSRSVHAYGWSWLVTNRRCTFIFSY